jgi:TRAP-type C4-dicarboxylate transport system permease small subunit
MTLREEALTLPEGVDPRTPRMLLPLARLLHLINRGMVGLGMLALLAASGVLTYSVISRYVMQASTDWQDETAVFCLVGATFLCGAFVQSLRGHVGIEAVSTLLPASVNRLRQVGVDAMCGLFCGFFSWKSWTLFHEAWAEHYTTSSSWAPPLAIPYGLMALGMSLLTLQLLVQLSASLNRCINPSVQNRQP